MNDAPITPREHVINARNDSRTLREIGVKPGWFCQHAGCSIWLEVTNVFRDNALICVSRSPENETDLVYHLGTYAGLDALSPTLPNYADAIWASPRAKNFYDKFHPEPDAVKAFLASKYKTPVTPAAST